MRIALISLLFAALSANAGACDWTVTKKVDPMTDKVICRVSSPSAKISFYRYGTDKPKVVFASAYRDPWLDIRLDDNPAISISPKSPERQRSLELVLAQLQTAKRIRTSFQDYPNNQEGDAPVCNLPQLIEDCGK